MSLAADVNVAKALAYSFPRIAEGIQQRERATMSLTAVVEDGFNVGDESIKFAIVTMEDSGIKLVKVNEMPPYAELARQELHL